MPTGIMSEVKMPDLQSAGNWAATKFENFHEWKLNERRRTYGEWVLLSWRNRRWKESKFKSKMLAYSFVLNELPKRRRKTHVANFCLLATLFGQNLRALALTCAHFNRDQRASRRKLFTVWPPNARPCKFYCLLQVLKCRAASRTCFHSIRTAKFRYNIYKITCLQFLRMNILFYTFIFCTFCELFTFEQRADI